MRPILCVIDMTSESMKVLEVAARLASANKRTLTVLFPYRLIDFNVKGEGPGLKATLEQDARNKFTEMKRSVTLLNDISVDFIPAIGFPEYLINSHVSRNKVGMIVISQRLANSIGEIKTGALQNLIAGSRVPFTIVPDEVDAESYSVESV